MRFLVALVFAAATAFVASVMTMALSASLTETMPSALMWTALGVTFVASLVYMLRGTRTAAKVAARGFLVGAVLWLAFIPLSWVVGAQTPGSNASSVAFVGMFSSAVGVVLAGACLVGYAVARAFGTERAPEASKVCPQCAERVQPAALVCRFCGYEFAATVYVA